MENNIVVYRHVRLDTNEVFYIGIGNEKRPYSKRNRNKWWKNIVDKTDYRVDILFDNLTWDEAYKKEKEFIQLYGRRDLGLGTLVNLTDGGEGVLGNLHSEETKLKMSLARKGKPKSEETKLKMRKPKSEEHQLKLNQARKKITEETKLKMSLARKGKPKSEEHKLKISQCHKGKIVSDETKLKISEAKKGKNRKNKS